MTHKTPRPDAAEDTLPVPKAPVSGLADTHLDKNPPGRPMMDSMARDVLRSTVAAELFGQTDNWRMLGRFRLLGRLGEGGMGTVYTARDDTLNRNVAVKVLREGTCVADAVGRERLLREAKALASISHTNVVAVHEVGEDDGKLFIAMEFVQGKSLHTWLREQVRSYIEVIDVFTQAAAGLQAAHCAGLVHRDFKPHNAVLSEDGVVKVLDFGLVRGGQALDATVEELDDLRLTMTGAILGTPAYMSPEQFRHEVVTPASDQFSLCVSIFEGIYGYLPFRSSNLAGLMEDILCGQVRAPPRDSPVPAWLHRVVLRGLNVDPDQRYDDMQALIDALRNDPVARRKKVTGIALGVTFVAATSAGLASLWVPQNGPEPCSNLSAPLEEIWNRESAEAMRDAFTQSDFGAAGLVWEKVESGLGDYTNRWQAQRLETCQAHAVGGISGTQYDRSHACLNRQISQFKEVVEQLRQADAAAIEFAPTAVAALPSTERCGDPTYLLAQHPPPDDDGTAHEVAAARDQLGRAQALIDLGRYERAQDYIDKITEVANTLNYPPLSAETKLSRGVVYLLLERGEEAVDALTEAFHLSIAHDYPKVACEALSRRIFVQAELLGKPQEAVRDIRLGQSLLARVPNDPKLTWLLENNAGTTKFVAGDVEGASAHYTRALSVCEAAGDELLYEAGVTQFNTGLLHEGADRSLTAISHYERGLDATKRVVGSVHPLVVDFSERLAGQNAAVGRLESAQEWISQGLEILERIHQPDSVEAVPLLLEAAALTAVLREENAAKLARRAVQSARSQVPVNIGLVNDAEFVLGEVLVETGSINEGLDAQRAVLPAFLQDERPQVVAAAEMRHAKVLHNAGEVEEAVAHAQKAVALVEHTTGPGAPELVAPMFVLAKALLVNDKAGKAEATAERALDILGEASSTVMGAKVRIVRAEARVDLGRPKDAVGDHAAALEVMETTFDANHPELADLRFGYARALAMAGDRERALMMARASLASYDALGPKFSEEASALRTWIASQVEP